MKRGCIIQVSRKNFVMADEWQLKFCTPSVHGISDSDVPDRCAALLINFFDYWHNWKLDTLIKNKKYNDVSERHGDKRTQDETIYQYHTYEELEDGILGFFSQNTIRNSIEFLKKIGVISTHSNPNPKYKFDKTIYYIFYPDVCNKFIIDNELNHRYINTESSSPEKQENRSYNSEVSYLKIEVPIAEIYNNKKDILTDIQKRNPKSEDEGKNKAKEIAIEKPIDVDKEIWDEFLKLRKNKKAPITKRVIDHIRKEAAKNSKDLKYALEMCVVKGWSSYEAEWDKNFSKRKSGWNEDFVNKDYGKGVQDL